jgi:probable rRNA maturation factor
MKANIIISSDSRYDVDRDFLRQVVISVLERMKLKGKIEVGLNIVGDRMITDLNKKYRGKKEATCVLSFPLEEVTPAKKIESIKKKVGFVKSPDKVLRLGDVIISYPQAQEEAVRQRISIDEELSILVEHGICHLLGIHQD